MFKLKIRSLSSDYGTTTEQLVTDFLRAIGFLGNDGGRNKVTKRSQTGILLFTKCLIISLLKLLLLSSFKSKTCLTRGFSLKIFS